MTATIPEQVFDQALEAAFDVLAKCETGDCRAPAVGRANHGSCSWLLCTRHTEAIMHNRANAIAHVVTLCHSPCGTELVRPQDLHIHNA
jgi:hypothetical protein